MIALKRAAQPAQLTPELISKLRDEYAVSGTSVWNKKIILETLLCSSLGKCAYCETKINEESKYMEVDHFRCKDRHPDLVMDWQNFVPSCKRCNIEKGTYDIDTDGYILNPFSDTPSEHLYVRNYRLKPKSQIGRRSIEVLYLNDSDRMVKVRCAIGEKMHGAIETAYIQFKTFLTNTSDERSRRLILRSVRKILQLCSATEEYSAISATILTESAEFQEIRDSLRTLDLWSELDLIEGIARKHSLDSEIHP